MVPQSKSTAEKSNPSQHEPENLSSANKKDGFFSGSFFQPSLEIGMPDDPYEQEAEKVSQQVMQQYEIASAPSPDVSPNALQTMLIQPMLSSRQISRRMQRRLQRAILQKCAACEKEERMLNPKLNSLQRSGNGNVADENIENEIVHSQGGGHSMDGGTKAVMETSFGADFSRVKVHTDNKAVQMSKDLGAHAFTVGSDIYFNEGKYQPETKEGVGLLSHELTHVVQQGAAVQTKRDASLPGNNNVSNPALLHNINSGALQQSAIFRKAISQFQNNVPPADRLQQQQMLQTKAIDKVQMADNAKSLRRCAEGCGSSCNSSSAPSPAEAGAGPVCAQPINWTHTGAADNGPDGIRINISWESSTGSLSDLSNCTVREVVNYDAIPNPPFTWNPPNPTILTVPAVNGAGMDTHSYPPGLASIPTPRVAGTMVAHQVYQWKCTGTGCDGNWHDFPSQNYTITREVFGSGVNWSYKITKTGGVGFTYSRTVALP